MTARRKRFIPFNSLFTKIFLWFWLTTVAMIFGTWWLSHQFMHETRYLPAAAEELQHARRVADKFNSSPLLGRFSAPQPLLEALGARQRLALVLLDADSDQLFTGFPGGQHLDPAPFQALTKQGTPLRIDMMAGHFIGPLAVTWQQRSWWLFVGRPKPPGLLPRMREHPWLVVSLFLGISSLFCLALSWSIVRPIRQLRLAAQGVAQGQLDARVEGVARRKDEVGELGRDFNHMATQLQHMLDSQKRLLADISHELRSPLARLQLAVGIAQEKSPNVPAELERIELESGRIEKMLANLLTLARLDAGQSGLRRAPISLDELLAPLCQDLRFEAQAQHKAFHADYPATICLQADKGLLGAAIENVLRNALKYARKRVTLVAKVVGDELQLQINDDGPGVPIQELNRIFKPFYRVSNARSRDTGGTGLGLAIARRAVQAHGGQIQARKGEMGGLEVCIDLKLHACT